MPSTFAGSTVVQLARLAVPGLEAEVVAMAVGNTHCLA